MNLYHNQLVVEHQARMSKRNTKKYQAQPIEDFIGIDSDNVKITLAVAAKLLETFNVVGIDCEFYGYQFSEYYNDSYTQHNRPWFEDVKHEHLKVLTGTTLGQIDFYIDENDCIVIDRIISNQKGNGSKMVDLILNMSDEIGLVVVTTPTCIETVKSIQQAMERTQGLRKWMYEFGFEDIKGSAKMMYIPNC